MTTDLVLTVRREEAVLVRVLGLIVRRGFEPVRVAARMDTDRPTFRVEVTVASDRPIEPLTRQLRKLHAVENVEIAGDAAARQSSCCG